jgi:3-phenylpropionate/trans-cinnamate dioxygenase ferredoxin subunit
MRWTGSTLALSRNPGRTAARYVVCPVDELPPGSRKIIDADGRQIGVFNVDGHFFALHNRCPHRAAPLCRGVVKGLVDSPTGHEVRVLRKGEILQCPWHGWEFDLTNGQSVFNPHRIRARTYPVTTEAWPADEPEPSVDSFEVTVELGGEHSAGQEIVVVHVG